MAAECNYHAWQILNDKTMGGQVARIEDVNSMPKRNASFTFDSLSHIGDWTLDVGLGGISLDVSDAE